MRLNRISALIAVLLEISVGTAATRAEDLSNEAGPAVGPQYGSTHVYVAPQDFDRFVASILATFGGIKSQQAVVTVTPTPSQAISQLVQTPVGMLSVFGFKTPIPYPFGIERTGYLVTDLDAAVSSAARHGADIVVAPFNDAIGRDAIIAWPGGVHMQLYWHTIPPNYAKLETVPDNRVYVSAEQANAFVRSFVDFSGGKVVADDRQAPGIEIGRPDDVYRRVRIVSAFGNISLLVSDGHLPYPYGRDIAGYEVADLSATLTKAKGAGATVLVDPYNADQRRAALIEFPGGYVAEVHSPSSK
jgi:predicted enzyme related to lactoylglutathione lyase